MPKAKPSVSVNQTAASKEIDEMKMRKNLGKLAQLSREALIEADVKAIESLMADTNALWDAFGQHCGATDHVAIGREPTPIEIARRDVAEADFEIALMAFLSYSPKTIQGVSLKAALLEREECLSENIADHWEVYVKSFVGPDGQHPSHELQDQGVSRAQPSLPVNDLIEAHRLATAALKNVPGEVDYDDDCPEWVAENAALDALVSHVPLNACEVQELATYLRSTTDLVDRVLPAPTNTWTSALVSSLLAIGPDTGKSGPANLGNTDVQDLINAHRQAHAAANVAPPEMSEPEREKLWDAADDTFVALLSHKSATLDDIAAVAHYLNEDHEQRERVFPAGCFTDVFFDALLTLRESGSPEADLLGANEADVAEGIEMVAVTVAEDAFGYKKGQRIIADPAAIQQAGDELLILREMGGSYKYEILMASETENGLATAFAAIDGAPFEASLGEIIRNKGVVLGATKVRPVDQAEPAGEKPCHSHAHGLDFGRASNAAFQLIEQHKAADTRFSAASEEADRPYPEEPTTEQIQERTDAMVAEMSAAIACAAYWSTCPDAKAADRIAIEQHVEDGDLYSSTLREVIELPTMLIAALAKAFVKPELPSASPSERLISALEAHRIAFARMEAISNRDEFTQDKSAEGAWLAAYDRYLAATVELFSVGAYHQFDDGDLNSIYQDYEAQHLASNASPALDALRVMPEEWRLILLEHYRAEAIA